MTILECVFAVIDDVDDDDDDDDDDDEDGINWGNGFSVDEQLPSEQSSASRLSPPLVPFSAPFSATPCSPPIAAPCLPPSTRPC